MTDDSLTVNSGKGQEVLTQQVILRVSVKTKSHRRRNALIGLGTEVALRFVIGAAGGCADFGGSTTSRAAYTACTISLGAIGTLVGSIVAFVVWIGLLLAPVFVEIELWRLKLKQEIASVKEHVDTQVQSLRADIRNSVDIRSQFNPQITLMTPPPDAQLPKIAAHLRETLETGLKSYGLERQPPLEVSPTVPRDAVLFFEVRYSIEKELRRIWEQRFPPGSERRDLPLPALQMTRELVNGQYISPPLGRAIREVYRVCSPAIHGQQVTEAQKRFVQEVTPDLLRNLRAIK